LNDELKTLSLLRLFPDENSLSIPGLWPPCLGLDLGLKLYSLGLKLCDLVLGLLLVLHSWRGKPETYWLKDVRIYSLFTLISLKSAMHYLLFLLSSYFFVVNSWQSQSRSRMVQSRPRLVLNFCARGLGTEQPGLPLEILISLMSL